MEWFFLEPFINILCHLAFCFPSKWPIGINDYALSMVETHQGPEGGGRIWVLPHISQILPNLSHIFLPSSPEASPWMPSPPSQRPIPLAAPLPRTEHPCRHLIYHWLTSNHGSSPLGHSVTFILVLKTWEGHCWQKSRSNEFYVLETEKRNYFSLKGRAGRKPTEQSPLGGKESRLVS